ncbi:MAG: molybdenum cofactor guanylyltransferase [Actinobacteria bacterium]|nr:molybdenum cofactor guanylyltransferase [Actinomycetota bacterium]
MSDTLPAFSGVVLACGRNRRMGTDKALLPVGGRAMAAVARDALLGAGASEVLAVGGDAAALTSLGFRVVADRWPGDGPLGGVVTALAEATCDVVVVLACDLPLIEAAAVTTLLRHLGDADAVVPFVAGQPQVLVAAYRRACARELENARAAGQRRLRDAVGRLRLADAPLEPRWVHNVNQAADLEGLTELEGDGEGIGAPEGEPDDGARHH